ncbi:MAG: DUF1616 domain-containing protein [Candidatus Helarchaeota archaeon]
MADLKKNHLERRQELFILAAIVVAIIVVSAMLIYSFFTIQVERFSYLGLLDENKTTSNYPQTVYNNTPFYLWAEVGNLEGSVNLYLINITLGNENSTINNTEPSGNSALFLKKYLVILENQQSKMVHINISINKIVNNSILIFELWIYDTAISDFQYLGIWVQLWLNITKGP